MTNIFRGHLYYSFVLPPSIETYGAHTPAPVLAFESVKLT